MTSHENQQQTTTHILVLLEFKEISICSGSLNIFIELITSAGLVLSGSVICQVGGGERVGGGGGGGKRA